MKQTFSIRFAALAAAAVTLAGCTMDKQDAPALAGPSEFGQSITVSVSPDVLMQDGASQSVVTAMARGANGAALANLSLRAEIVVNGVPTDFGRLSARSLVTDSSGRATVIYTAPASPAGPVVDEFTLVNIHVTPVGSDFGNSTPRVTTLRLVPPNGVIAPPDGLQPAFTFTPGAPIDNQSVLFNASTSQAPANNPIVQYRWDFGDGSSATGVTTTHAYSTPDTYTVTLTVVDGYGRSRSTSQSLTVNAGTNPTALFTFSPAAPTTQTTVLFNAAASQPAPGRRIVSYAWDFGDPNDHNSGGSGAQTSHRYSARGTYTVTLVVTDDAGRRGTSSVTVTVLP